MTKVGDIPRVDANAGRKYSDDALLELMRRFSVRYLDRIRQDNLPDEAPEDGQVDEAAGFDLMLQVIYASYFDLADELRRVQARRLAPPRVLVPETLEVEAEPVLVGHAQIATCPIVPETMAMNTEPAPWASWPPRSRRRSGVDLFDEGVDQHGDGDGDGDDDVLQVNEKYPIVTSRDLRPFSPTFSQRKGGGVGLDVSADSGSSPLTLRLPRPEAIKTTPATSSIKDEAEESPSLLLRSKVKHETTVTALAKCSTEMSSTTKATVSRVNGDDDMDDFDEKKSPPLPPSAPGKQPEPAPTSKVRKIKRNRYDLEITPITLSQKQRQQNMKQKKLDGFFKKGHVAVTDKEGKPMKVNLKRERKENLLDDDVCDPDVLRAIKASEETLRQEEKARQKRTSPLLPRTIDNASNQLTPNKKDVKREDMDHSFNHLTPPAKKTRDGGVQPKFKFVGSPEKRREARRLLEGFSCPECKAFYAGADLTLEQVRQLIQKCSRHRSNFAPLADSPKACWTMNIDDGEAGGGGGPLCKTQLGEPLRTRARRKKKL